ncbi:MAG: hypothetical protein GEU95_06490 [Rhizobiales bacterium]|nr:hypothetical protein [Hyphomicrobiales bacterium]
MHEQPFGTLDVIIRYGVSEQIVERAQRNASADLGRLGNGAPFLRQSTLLGVRLEKFKPAPVVACDRRVVERLRIVRASAAFDQQRGECCRVWMRRLVAFALAERFVQPSVKRALGSAP